jgi:hypothetical protein
MGWFSRMPSSEDAARARAALDAAHRDAERARDERDAARQEAARRNKNG